MRQMLILLVYVGFGVLLYLFVTGRPGEPGEGTVENRPATTARATPEPALARSTQWLAGGKTGRAIIAPTWAIDLESGRQDEGAGPRDLWWQAMTASRRCLCPLTTLGARTARLTTAQYDGMDASALKQLEFGERGFAHGEEGNEVRPGLVFAVRTGEGGIARVKVLAVDADNNVEIEWQMVGREVQKAAMRGNPSIKAGKLIGEARTAIRARDMAAATTQLDEAAELVLGMEPGTETRISLLYDLGSLYWSTRNLDAALGVTAQAAGEIGQRADGGAGLPWELVARVYRWMGVLNRDRGDLPASIPWHERALEVARGAKPRDHNDAGARAMAMTSNLRELKDAECRGGDREKGQEWLRQLKEACKGTNAIGVCQKEFWSC